MPIGVVIATLAGCGRVGFDPLGDQATGHDEDGDGVPDSVDVCPFLDDDQRDQDDDGVGDACDPEPVVRRQRIALFLAMTADDPVIPRQVGTWRIRDDSWETTGIPYSDLEVDVPLVSAEIYAGLDVIAHPAFPQQIGIDAGDFDGMPYYYGEVYRNDAGGNGFTGLSHYDGGTSYSPVNHKPLTTPFPIGSTTVHLTVEAVNPQMAFSSDLVQVQPVSSSTPLFTGASSFAVTVQSSIVAVRYMAVIVTER